MNELRALSVALVCMGLLIAAPGCSLFVPSKQVVTITASAPDARIMVDGNDVGTGKVAVDLERNRRHTVIAQSGSRQGAAAINKKISTTGVLDIVGGCLFLVPFLGCLGPGFWDLDPTEVNVIIPQ